MIKLHMVVIFQWLNTIHLKFPQCIYIIQPLLYFQPIQKASHIKFQSSVIYIVSKLITVSVNNFLIVILFKSVGIRQELWKPSAMH